MLLERCQSRKSASPVYRVIDESGPGHSRIFTIAVSINGEILGVGKGRSKKQAEQSAARNALANLSDSD